MRIAAVQMVSGENLSANLAQLTELVKQAAEQGAELVLLPENFAMLDSGALRDLAERQQRSVQPLLADLARQCRVTLIAGSLPMADRSDGSAVPAPRVRAACLVFGSDGNLQARYDKVHLFDVDVADAHGSYRESDLIEPGTQLVVAGSPAGRLGLSICYDLRFPEMYQQLRAQGAELLLMPAAFTYTTGEAHWETLLRARAIETQCYLLAANQGGQHSPSRRTWGHSMILDPWGRILAERTAEGPGVVIADLDPDLLRHCREQMPLLQHRNRAGF